MSRVGAIQYDIRDRDGKTPAELLDEVGLLDDRLVAAHRIHLTAVDLSRIYAAPITRLGCLAFEGQGAFASQS